MLSRLKFYITQPVFWVALLVVLTYMVLILNYISRYDMNPTSLLQIGHENPYYSADIIDAGYLVYHHSGYDGQYNYYILKDFLFKGDFPEPYRYQRILYPLLVYIFSFGKSNFYPLIFIVINLISIGLGMHILMELLGEYRDLNLFLTVLFGLNIGFLVSVLYDLGTPLAMLFILIGYCYFRNDKIILSSLFFALSLLTMENAVLIIIPLLIWCVWLKNWRNMMLLLLCFIPWSIWQIILYWQFGQLPIFSSAGYLTYPFIGIIDYFRMQPWLALETDILIRQLNVFPFIIFLLAILLISGIQFFKDKTIEAGIVFFHSIFGILLSNTHIWSHTITSPSRVLCGIFPFLFLLYTHSREKRLLSILIIGAWLLTVIGLLRIAYLPQHPYFIMMK